MRLIRQHSLSIVAAFMLSMHTTEKSPISPVCDRTGNKHRRLATATSQQLRFAMQFGCSTGAVLDFIHTRGHARLTQIEERLWLTTWPCATIPLPATIGEALPDIKARQASHLVVSSCALAKSIHHRLQLLDPWIVRSQCNMAKTGTQPPRGSTTHHSQPP